ncbi:MAG: WecB/TagA/CpsF family glycosyltransferase [Acidobacteria bacterium]|nr:WecB/TagA/CpsF family glycosyltransferase [Acidobacteriota bacterium]
MPTEATTAESIAPTSAAGSLPTETVAGTPLVLGNYDSVMDWMDDVVASGEQARLSAATVHLVMGAREDPETAIALEGCVTVPDGQPLVWALNSLGHPEASRVYGPELMSRYCARSAKTGVPMYLYGGRDRPSLDLLISELERRYPGLNIVGSYCPPFRPLDEVERRDVLSEIESSGAQVVWVGIGQPKQEHWMSQMRHDIGPVLMVGVGAAFDFHAGLVRQAPAWMQRLGLEWLYRLTQEPKRLWARYARYNPLFIVAFARQYLQLRRSGK